MANELIARGKVESLCVNGTTKPYLDFWQDGPHEDKHKGFRRSLSGHDRGYRRTSSLEKGAEVLNLRSWSGLSQEEVKEVENAIRVDIHPGILLENLIVSGVPNFSKLAPTSRLVFPMRSGLQAILLVMEENSPC